MVRASNVRIRSMDIPIIDRVFGMEGGYVLNFTNRSFATTYDMQPARPRWLR